MKSYKKIVEICKTNGIAYSIGIVLIALSIIFGLICLQSWLIMLFWNWLAVDLFALPTLNFWHAFGLQELCFLLFKSTAKISIDNDEK